jgi:hypothetical protein
MAALNHENRAMTTNNRNTEVQLNDEMPKKRSPGPDSFILNSAFELTTKHANNAKLVAAERGTGGQAENNIVHPLDAGRIRAITVHI